MQYWMMIYSQNSNSPLMEHMIFTMDHSMTIIMSILSVTSITLVAMISNNPFIRFSKENMDIEVFWTIVPALMLWFIGIPSIKTLFLSEDLMHPTITFKSIGHQWYWSYEYTDKTENQFDSFMENKSKIRLMSTNNHLILPFKTPIRSLITSEDVIHSWAIPSMSIKSDALPGRINQVSMYISRPGIFTGQCSELCGTGHSFMPIMISSISTKEFMKSMK